MTSLVIPGNSSKGELEKKREKKTTTMVQVETKLSARSILVNHPGITQTVLRDRWLQSPETNATWHTEKNKDFTGLSAVK